MSERGLMALLVVQSLILGVLVFDRVVPVAHAGDAVRCEITNWPDALTGTGFQAVRVTIEDVKKSIPVDVKDWSTSDRVGVAVKDWDTYDKVKVQIDQ